MKYTIKFLSLTLSILCMQQGQASGAVGEVQFVLPHVGNYVFFNIVGKNSSDINNQGLNDNCITTNTGYFLIDLNQPTGANTPSNESGPAIYAALLLAKAQGRTIQVRGSNTCISGREKVNWILVR